MNSDLDIVLFLLVAAIAMFATTKPRMDAVALPVVTALPFTGVLTVEEALAGFGDANIVLIAAPFVIGEGLVRIGVARGGGDALVEKAGGNETRLLVLLMLAVGGLGAVMSSAPLAADFARRVPLASSSRPARCTHWPAARAATSCSAASSSSLRRSGSSSPTRRPRC